MIRLRGYGARLALLALAALSFWEIGALLRVGREVAGEADWQSAAGAVRAGFAAGDLVVFAPEWADPLGRQALGDLLRLEDAGRMDAARYARIWEVSLRGAEAEETRSARLLGSSEHGAVRVRLFERTAAIPSWDTRRGSVLREVDFRPRGCQLLQLREPRQVERLAFPDVPLSETLHVAAGLADSRVRRDNRATARLEVWVDGRPATGALLDERSGWLALPPAPTLPGPHDVELVASVERWSGPVRIDLCVAAESRSAP